MLKTLMLSAALTAGCATVALAGVESLQSGRSAAEAMEHPMYHHHMLHHHMRHHHTTANGHCNGKSYGTGQLGCGTASGGPVGGNPSRN